ncbi:uncharacterized protein LOC142541843 [Primulina tabacum]|uniref:uncharacterized protein LOC142541843 n=1 Tax=Primulina tabacum TaxID=48773 RepID=UPI003F5936A1
MENFEEILPKARSSSSAPELRVLLMEENQGTPRVSVGGGLEARALPLPLLFARAQEWLEVEGFVEVGLVWWAEGFLEGWPILRRNVRVYGPTTYAVAVSRALEAKQDQRDIKVDRQDKRLYPVPQQQRPQFKRSFPGQQRKRLFQGPSIGFAGDQRVFAAAFQYVEYDFGMVFVYMNSARLRVFYYSPSKDAAFCFPCFLFEHKHPRNPAFTIDGFKYWKRVNDGDRCAFLMHIGCNTSTHNNAVEYLDNLMNIPRHIDKVINAQSSEAKQKNRLRLTATIESIRWLTLQACAFRGHDESPSSNNRGNFIEMINFIGKMNKNIQKDVLNIISNQVRAKIRKEIEDAKFCILVDEARDASNKEQMAIVLRFVDTEGFLRERFFAILHGYDSARNMCGSWNGLQALFLKECSCAYYVHCFAHRLQLALTGTAEKEVSICSVITVLENILNYGASNSICGEASGALIAMKSFDFIFILHLMHKIIGITNLLCRALQEKSLDFLSAMDYVSTTKNLLRTLREEGFDLLLSHVKEVCVKYDIEIPHMEARYRSGTGRSCQHNDSITVEHHYRFDVFTAAIDFQVEDLNNIFKDESVELLKLSCALEPKEKFKLLNVDHIYRLAEKFYYLDFDSQDLHHLIMQLDHYKLGCC